MTSQHGFQQLLLIGIKDTRCIWGYTIKKKSDAKQCIKNWLDINFQLIPHETRPTCLQTDNAKELDCSDIAAQHGIKYRTTGTYSPQQNGYIERALAEVEKMTLALLIQANFPKEYWTHAARHAITIWNRLPNPRLDWLTPMEVTYLKLGYGSLDLRVFGCLATAQIPGKKHRKLDFERNMGISVGNSGNSPDLFILVPGGKVIKSQHVFLHEHLRGIAHKSILVSPDKNCLPQITRTPNSGKLGGRFTPVGRCASTGN